MSTENPITITPVPHLFVDKPAGLIGKKTIGVNSFICKMLCLKLLDDDGNMHAAVLEVEDGEYGDLP